MLFSTNWVTRSTFPFYSITYSAFEPILDCNPFVSNERNLLMRSKWWHWHWIGGQAGFKRIMLKATTNPELSFTSYRWYFTSSSPMSNLLLNWLSATKTYDSHNWFQPAIMISCASNFQISILIRKLRIIVPSVRSVTWDKKDKNFN